MLEEIGVPYELTVMTRDERKSAEHISRHPLGRVPVIELDDGRLLFESAAICIQLADLHPEAGLIPPVGSPERGLVYQWSLPEASASTPSETSPGLSSPACLPARVRGARGTNNSA